MQVFFFLLKSGISLADLCRQQLFISLDDSDHLVLQILNYLYVRIFGLEAFQLVFNV